MRTLQLTQEISSDTIKDKMKSALTVADFKRWQIIYFVSTFNVDAEFISQATGYSKANVYSVVQQFNRTKQFDVGTKPKGGRKRELMSIQEEQQLMASLEDNALRGQILSGKDIRKIVEEKVNKRVSDDYIWDLFKRNGWTKHSPRPHHPMKSNDKQEEFKKNSKTIWLPLKMLLPQN